MIDDEKLERMLKALESIADSLGHLSIISENLESLAGSTYELNENFKDIIGSKGSDRPYIRNYDMGRD